MPLFVTITGRFRGMALAASLVAPTAWADAPAQIGKDVYEQGCIVCHGADGKGAIPGVPDLTSRGGPLSKPESLLVEHALKGFQSPGSSMAMPPKGGNQSLTPEQIEHAVRYMRSVFAR